MTAFNAVRFRVKPGRDQDFLNAHKNVAQDWPGLRHANIIKTGEGRYCIIAEPQCEMSLHLDHTYCVIAEWTDVEALARARPKMIATLNSFRDTLEELGGGLGVTDAVSGPVVTALR